MKKNREQCCICESKKQLYYDPNIKDYLCRICRMAIDESVERGWKIRNKKAAPAGTGTAIEQGKASDR